MKPTMKYHCTPFIIANSKQNPNNTKYWGWSRAGGIFRDSWLKCRVVHCKKQFWQLSSKTPCDPLCGYSTLFNLFISWTFSLFSYYNAAMKSVYKFLHVLSFLLGHMPIGIAGSYSNSFTYLLKNCQAVFQSDHIPNNSLPGFQFLHILANTC